VSIPVLTELEREDNGVRPTLLSANMKGTQNKAQSAGLLETKQGKIQEGANMPYPVSLALLKPILIDLKMRNML
jgi:hypothetical protein